MNRGDLIFLKRPKRLLAARCFEDYHPYPAVRVRFERQDRPWTDKVVSRAEVITAQEREKMRFGKEQETARPVLAPLISAWAEGNHSLGRLSAACDWHWLATYNRIRKAKRLGLIE